MNVFLHTFIHIQRHNQSVSVNRGVCWISRLTELSKETFSSSFHPGRIKKVIQMWKYFLVEHANELLCIERKRRIQWTVNGSINYVASFLHSSSIFIWCSFNVLQKRDMRWAIFSYKCAAVWDKISSNLPHSILH